MKEQTTIRLPAELLEQLKQEAQVAKVSMETYLMAVIKDRCAPNTQEKCLKSAKQRDAVIDEFIKS